MDELHKKMTWEEYLTFPRKLGWKHEYFGGALHLSPAWTAIASFRLSLDSLEDLQSRLANAKWIDTRIRPVVLSDLEPLLSLFCECFSDSIEYCGCDSSNLRRYANESLAYFFQTTPKKYFNACRVAVKGDRVIGCCMIEGGKHGPLLQPIFVAPEYQRYGIATRLLLEAVQTLSASGEMCLHSRCNIGNESSLAWHLQCRFEEIPSRWTAGHRANIYSQEAERQKILQLPTANSMRELAEYWADQRDRLENEPTFDL